MVHVQEPTPLSVRAAGAVSVVTVTGALDLAGAAPFRKVVNDLVIDGRVRLVVDLTAVDFVDSVGLGVLVATHRKTRGLQGSLTLVLAGERTARLLGLTGLDRVLQVATTLDDALVRAST